jgi:hypothetical protein
MEAAALAEMAELHALDVKAAPSVDQRSCEEMKKGEAIGLLHNLKETALGLHALGNGATVIGPA